jgi:hypothetical protein
MVDKNNNPEPGDTVQPETVAPQELIVRPEGQPEAQQTSGPESVTVNVNLPQSDPAPAPVASVNEIPVKGKENE